MKVSRAARAIILSFFIQRCSVAQNDLPRELRNKSMERGLAISRVRGNLVDIIPFDADRIGCLWRHPVYSASFSSDGAKVIVVDDRGVTIQRIDGSIISTAEVKYPNLEPWLSPDGKQLLFETSHLTSTRTPSGYFFATIGSDQVEMIESEIAKSGLAAGLVPSAGWSTDNRTVVYAHDGQIIELDLRSKHKVVLGRGTNPTWSPDNKWIAYKTEDGTARLMTPDGLTQTDVMKGHRILGFLHWSPDSEYLMYGEEFHPSSWNSLWDSLRCLLAQRLVFRSTEFGMGRSCPCIGLALWEARILASAGFMITTSSAERTRCENSRSHRGPTSSQSFSDPDVVHQVVDKQWRPSPPGLALRAPFRCGPLRG